MRKNQTDKLKKLYQEVRYLILLYQYAIYYNNLLNNQELQKENQYVKKLVLTKKFMGKDIIVN